MRLVDVDALAAEFSERGRKYRKERSYAKAREADAAQCIVRQAPTIEAVEVVHCKDCRYSENFKKWNGRDYLGCRHNIASICEVEQMHYCSYGERRIGNATDQRIRTAKENDD